MSRPRLLALALAFMVLAAVVGALAVQAQTRMDPPRGGEPTQIFDLPPCPSPGPYQEPSAPPKPLDPGERGACRATGGEPFQFPPGRKYVTPQVTASR